MEHIDKLAVITGASSGIGYELSKVFVEEGYDVVIVAEDSGIFKVAKELESSGAQVIPLLIDLAEDSGVDMLYSRIKAERRPVDVVCINAGIGVGGASFDKTDLEKELKLVRLNVLSVVHLTKYILQDMIHRGEGKILFTSSVAAFMPGPFESVYSASKAFVQSFAEGLAVETKDKGITITALQPGPTETNFFHRADMDDTKIGPKEKDDPAMVARAGYDALMDGKDRVITGLKNKVEANIARVMPQTVSAKLHKSMTLPNSPHDR